MYYYWRIYLKILEKHVYLICEHKLKDNKVKDHCYLIDKYRGVTHNICNRNFKFNYKVCHDP